MIISFVFPSSHHRTGGVRVLYEFANALARRGHTVNFLHGPLTRHRVSSVSEIPFDFDRRIHHRIFDDITEHDLPRADVVFLLDGPPELGIPCVVVQGYQMFDLASERAVFVARAPKVCVASWLVEVGRSFGVPDEQLWHVPNGIDHSMFSPPPDPAPRPIDLAVLYHPFPQKGWALGLAALELLHQRRPELRSLVFGMALPPTALPAGVELLLAPDHQHLAEQVYRRTKVFAQMSRVEGFGLTSVEAMACGAALVTTDNGGSRDYAFAGETALIVAPDDVAGMTAAIERLLDGEALRQRLATTGEQYVRRFDWDRSAELLEAHLERYLADPVAFQAAGTAHA